MNKRAQSIVEFAILLGIVAAALASMQIFFRRSINATVKIAADEVGRQSDAAGDSKWDSRDNSDADTSSLSSSTLTVQNRGRQDNNFDSTSTTTAQGRSLTLTEKNPLALDNSLGSGGGSITGDSTIDAPDELDSDEVMDPED